MNKIKVGMFGSGESQGACVKRTTSFLSSEESQSSSLQQLGHGSQNNLGSLQNPRHRHLMIPQKLPMPGVKG